MAQRAPWPVVATAVFAVLVTVLALGTVTYLRVQRGSAEDILRAGPPTPPAESVAATCGDQPCEVLTSLPVGRTTVELLADPDGGNGRLRVLASGSETVLETAMAAMGVRLTQKSLTCMTGPTSACVVRGRHLEGMAGEVFVEMDGRWQAADLRYFSDAGFLDLLRFSGDKSPEVGVAKLPDCPGSPAECPGFAVVVEVFSLDGQSLGCTPRYQTLTSLPGWPDVELTGIELGDCAGN